MWIRLPTIRAQLSITVWNSTAFGETLVFGEKMRMDIVFLMIHRLYIHHYSFSKKRSLRD
jgi:hypothetical protein